MKKKNTTKLVKKMLLTSMTFGAMLALTDHQVSANPNSADRPSIADRIKFFQGLGPVRRREGSLPLKKSPNSSLKDRLAVFSSHSDETKPITSTERKAKDPLAGSNLVKDRIALFQSLTANGGEWTKPQSAEPLAMTLPAGNRIYQKIKLFEQSRNEAPSGVKPIAVDRTTRLATTTTNNVVDRVKHFESPKNRDQSPVTKSASAESSSKPNNSMKEKLEFFKKLNGEINPEATSAEQSAAVVSEQERQEQERKEREYQEQKRQEREQQKQLNEEKNKEIQEEADRIVRERHIPADQAYQVYLTVAMQHTRRAQSIQGGNTDDDDESNNSTVVANPEQDSKQPTVQTNQDYHAMAQQAHNQTIANQIINGGVSYLDLIKEGKYKLEKVVASQEALPKSEDVKAVEKSLATIENLLTKIKDGYQPKCSEIKKIAELLSNSVVALANLPIEKESSNRFAGDTVKRISNLAHHFYEFLSKVDFENEAIEMDLKDSEVNISEADSDSDEDTIKRATVVREALSAIDTVLGQNYVFVHNDRDLSHPLFNLDELKDITDDDYDRKQENSLRFKVNKSIDQISKTYYDEW